MKCDIVIAARARQSALTGGLSVLPMARCACNPPIVADRLVALCNPHLWADPGDIIYGHRQIAKNRKVEL